jgi:hypothetical protein
MGLQAKYAILTATSHYACFIHHAKCHLGQAASQ